MKEIIFHGRGGHGAKTVSQLLADSAFSQGKEVQAFPEYGPERGGAPVVAYTRISDKKIRIHTPVDKADIIVVIDDSLLDFVDIMKKAKENAIVVVNKKIQSGKINQKLSKQAKVYVVNASDISIKELGSDFANIPLLGAMVKVTGIIDLKSIEDELVKMFESKGKQNLIEGNLNALKRGFEEVVYLEEPLEFKEFKSDDSKFGKKNLSTAGDLPHSTSLNLNTGSWRVKIPIVKNRNLINEKLDFLLTNCPEAAIKSKDGKFLFIDYKYCKGCGICSKIVGKENIEMR